MHSDLRILLFALFLPSSLYAQELATHLWKGVLRNDAGASVKTATIHLVGKNGEFVSGTSADGSFSVPPISLQVSTNSMWWSMELTTATQSPSNCRSSHPPAL
jgi:hypothetical protein